MNLLATLWQTLYPRRHLLLAALSLGLFALRLLARQQPLMFQKQ